MDLSYLNREATKSFLDREWAGVTHGQPVKLSVEEIATLKPIKFEGSQSWGCDPESNFGDFYSRWDMVDAEHKARVYRVGALRPGVRNEALYVYAGVRGPITPAHHMWLNTILKEVEDEYTSSTSGCCGAPLTIEGTCGCCGW